MRFTAGLLVSIWSQTLTRYPDEYGVTKVEATFGDHWKNRFRIFCLLIRKAI